MPDGRFRASESRDRKAFGIVQMSCGLHVAQFRHKIERQRFTELDKVDINAINVALQGAFSLKGRFSLEDLGSGPSEHIDSLPHTWLGEWSRYQPVGMPAIFFPGDAGSVGTQTTLLSQMCWTGLTESPNRPWRAPMSESSEH